MGDVSRPRGRIGIVVGLPREAAILRRVLGAATPPLACAGATPAGAARAAAEIAASGAGELLSFGFAGGLDPALRPGDIVVGAGVVAADGTMSATDDALAQHLCAALDSLECGWSAGLVADVDHVLATAAAKQEVAARTRAVIVDMESRAVAAAGLPFAILRVVVDPVERAIPASALAALTPSGRVNPLRLIAGLLRRPREVRDVRRLARDSSRARASLSRAAEALHTAFGLR